MKYYIGNIPYGNDLTHFGIKGMHWGVRRYQNSDGTLTSAGRKRYYGDYVQKRLAKKSDRYGNKFVKNYNKGNAIYQKTGNANDPRVQKYQKKAQKYLEAAAFGKQMLRTYNEMSGNEQRTIQKGYKMANSIPAMLFIPTFAKTYGLINGSGKLTRRTVASIREREANNGSSQEKRKSDKRYAQYAVKYL